ncbi:polyisoprenoid-binding protein YceI [Nakamurella sp. UYEF19]|uniref:hypothetical protein n=1 Tax=Nakamurella sp. UYEF19 TaxID=1756392 RepID=UPI0033984605
MSTAAVAGTAVEAIPTGKYRLDAESSAVEFATLRKDGAGWVAVGTLTVAGVAAPLELTVTKIRLAGGTLTVTATGSVDRYAHGVVKSRGMAGRRLGLTVSATFDKVAA